MAKFYGVVGFVQEQQEVRPGVWEDRVVEKRYYGDVIRNVRKIEGSQYLNDDLTVNNLISIVADAYANEHFSAIRYVEWMGSLWKVPSAEVQRPRVILTIGGVYNGPTPAVP